MQTHIKKDIWNYKGYTIQELSFKNGEKVFQTVSADGSVYVLWVDDSKPRGQQSFAVTDGLAEAKRHIDSLSNP